VPAVHDATAYLQEYRVSLATRDHLYWIPAVRNVLSIDYTLFAFFQLAFMMALSIDLIANPSGAFKNFRAACAKLNYPVGNVLLMLICFLLLFVPLYFGVAGLAKPHLYSLSATIIEYFLLFGSIGLIMFAASYLAIPLAVSKLGLYTEHQGGSVPD